MDHYRRVGEGMPLPIVVYDEPVSSGVAMPPALLARIVETVPTAAVIKLEDPPTPAKLTQIRRLLGDRAQIFGGLGGTFFLEELGRGAVGTMTGFAYAEILVTIYARFTSGDTPGARSVFERYLPPHPLRGSARDRARPTEGDPPPPWGAADGCGAAPGPAAGPGDADRARRHPGLGGTRRQRPGAQRPLSRVCPDVDRGPGPPYLAPRIFQTKTEPRVT